MSFQTVIKYTFFLMELSTFIHLASKKHPVLFEEQKERIFQNITHLLENINQGQKVKELWVEDTFIECGVQDPEENDSDGTIIAAYTLFFEIPDNSILLDIDVYQNGKVMRRAMVSYNDKGENPLARALGCEINLSEDFDEKDLDIITEILYRLMKIASPL